MWGNTTGWIIAAVIGAGMGFLLWLVASPPTPSLPTNATVFVVANKPISLPVPANTVVTEGTKDCNAGDLYLQAIADYDKKPLMYERFLGGAADKITQQQMPAVDMILKARDCKDFTLFSRNPSQILNYDNTEPPLDDLHKLGTICVNLGLIANLKKPPQGPQAVRLWEAAFVLGRHLYEERITFTELGEGHGLMQTAAINLQRYYVDRKDNTRAATIKNFLDEELAYQAKLNEAWKIIGGVDESYAGPYAGDIYVVALNSNADPMFRVEALKHIGHYRYNVRADKKGDQLRVRKVLGKMSDDASLPPSVKEAVKAAKNLTLEKHNMVGGNA